MNKKLVRGSLAGVAALALAAGGTTMAAWSDFNNITGNEAGAGVLKLTVSPNSGSSTVFDHIKMAPGQIGQQRNVYVASNDGDSTPSGRLYMSFKDVTGAEDGCDGNGEIKDDPDCGNTTNGGDFVDDATVQVTSYAVNSPGDCTQGYAPTSKVVTGEWGGNLSTLKTQAPHELTGNGTSLGGVNRSYLAPGQGLCVSITIGLATSVDNASQGDSATFTTAFNLEQADHGTPTTPLS